MTPTAQGNQSKARWARACIRTHKSLTINLASSLPQTLNPRPRKCLPGACPPPYFWLPCCPSRSHRHPSPLPAGATCWKLGAAALSLGPGPGSSLRGFVLESRRALTPAGGLEIQPTAGLFSKNEKWGVCASLRFLPAVHVSVLFSKGWGPGDLALAAGSGCWREVEGVWGERKQTTREKKQQNNSKTPEIDRGKASPLKEWGKDRVSPKHERAL